MFTTSHVDDSNARVDANVHINAKNSPGVSFVLLTIANLHHDDECGDHAVELRRHHYVLTDFADPPSRLYVVDGGLDGGGFRNP